MQTKFVTISLLIVTSFYLVVIFVASNESNKSFLVALKDAWVIFLGLIIYFSILLIYGD